MTFKQPELIRSRPDLHLIQINYSSSDTWPTKATAFHLPPRVERNKPGLTRLAGDLSRALALRDALILLDRDVWTVHRGRRGQLSRCISSSRSSWLQFSPKERWLPTSNRIVGGEHEHTRNMQMHALSEQRTLTCKWRFFNPLITTSLCFPAHRPSKRETGMR